MKYCVANMKFTLIHKSLCFSSHLPSFPPPPKTGVFHGYSTVGPIFLQCFNTVGWVKPIPDMTYNVFGGTLNIIQLNFNNTFRQHLKTFMFALY